ncbi:phage tail protein [Pseudomonas proteolytica]|uniref:phage tail protein n=1 Tax=Pseudomonas proteolytica TaxID=219574 RepID=UPI0030EE70D2
MSLKLNERYPGRFDNPSSQYPQGSFKNRSAPGVLDGSYLEKDWANDKEGLFQSLLVAAGITPNGQVDTVGSSQYFTALLQVISNSSPTYPGQVASFARDTPPEGWLKANGAAVSRTVYADLFNAIGTRFGPGNGTTTFNLPDARGLFVRGWSDGATTDVGRALGSLQADAVQNITGTFRAKSVGDIKPTGAFAQVGEIVGGSTDSATPGPEHISFDASRVARTSTETRPVNIAFLICIKF